MKQSILVFLLICAATLFGQDKSVITVKDSTVSHGVVIVNIHQSGNRLSCSAPSQLRAARLHSPEATG